MLKLPKMFYKPETGNYGVMFNLATDSETDSKKLSIAWHSCREEFGWDFVDRDNGDETIMDQFLFCCEDPKRVINFVKLLEKKAKIKDKDKVKLEKTNYGNIIAVKLSKFWDNPMRLSLLTILLRAGMKHVNRFTSTVKKNDYLAITQYALNKFIKGHQSFTKKHFDGWVNEFAEETIEDNDWFSTSFEAKTKKQIDKLIRK